MRIMPCNRTNYPRLACEFPYSTAAQSNAWKMQACNGLNCNRLPGTDRDGALLWLTRIASEEFMATTYIPQQIPVTSRIPLPSFQSTCSLLPVQQSEEWDKGISERNFEMYVGSWTDNKWKWYRFILGRATSMNSWGYWTYTHFFFLIS